MADWAEFAIKIPGKELLEGVRTILETLLIFLEILKVILETISLFLIDFGNPLRLLIEALLALILQLFESLKRTGLFGYFDIPNPLQDPGFDRFKGGYKAFTERFKASLFDSKDPFRPQPLPGSNKSGFVLIVADAESVFGMLRLINILMRFFGKELLSPQYTAPANLKVFPAGQKPGSNSVDALLQVASVFGAQLKGLAISWSLATNQFPPDPGFNDLVATVGSEFIPQKWLIERTSREGGPEILTKTSATNFEDKKGKLIKREQRIRDEQGDYFRKFEKYIVLDANTNTASYLLGQLGTFRYIDEDVTKDKTYYYRVRAFSGDLKVSSSGTISLPAPIEDMKTKDLIQKWPGKDVIMGRPSGIITGRVPNIPTDFDVLKVLKATFRMAFALGFHLELSPDAKFDDDGNAILGTSSIQIGRGSLANLAGPLGRLSPDTEFAALFGAGFSDAGTQAIVEPDPVTGKYPDVTHNYFSVKAQAARLTTMVAQAMLDNSGMLIPLKDLYQSTIPKPVSGEGYFSSGITTIEKMVLQFVNLPDNFPDAYDVKVYETYGFAYTDPNTRLNLLTAVQFIKSFTLGGTPPNWIQVSLLRDIIPWSGQFIYDLLARIDALLEAFKSALSELKAFIDLLIRKIDVMERFIKFLIEILNYLDNFSVGFYFLALPNTDRGIPGWIDAIDNAGGTRPPSGPGGYTAGIALAYAGPNVDAFATAFGLIF